MQWNNIFEVSEQTEHIKQENFLKGQTLRGDLKFFILHKKFLNFILLKY